MSNILPLLIGGVALVYLIGSSKSSTPTKSSADVGKIPPVVECIDLGNNLLVFPRIQVAEDFGQELPMIVVLHGRNGNEKQLANVIPKDLKARVFFLRANTKNNLFFIPRLKDKEEILAPALEKSGKDVLEGIDVLLGIYPTNRLILFGFSQGASLVLRLSEYKFNIPTYVMAFSGSLPSLLYPKKLNSNKIMQYHGNLDKTVPFELGINTFNAFDKMGFDIIFRQTKNSHIGPPKIYVEEFFKLAGF